MKNRSASWVVNEATEVPTGYSEHEMHPALRRTNEIIAGGAELGKRLRDWKAMR
jgi:hypothetical protein